MSLMTRYKFLKKLFPNDMIIFYKKGYYCVELDKYLFEWFFNDINLLIKYNINFLIIDNLVIEKHFVFKDNNYIKYSRIVIIEKVLLNSIEKL